MSKISKNHLFRKTQLKKYEELKNLSNVSKFKIGREAKNLFSSVQIFLYYDATLVSLVFFFLINLDRNKRWLSVILISGGKVVVEECSPEEVAVLGLIPCVGLFFTARVTSTLLELFSFSFLH